MKIKGIEFDEKKWTVETARREMKYLGLFKNKINKFSIKMNDSKNLYYRFVKDYDFKGNKDEILNDYNIYY
tara:strand:- start:313 stop:525 length:213 start_codon:yes stop_codon:yes gene_type:complete